jgi:L-ascorbate metabolism protein UlaG (beta-lactamase superfamily)
MRTLLLFLLLSAGAAAQSCRLEAAYLANEGVILSFGEQKVVIDALFRKAMEPYRNHDAAVLTRLEAAVDEFSGVDIVLATHRHADHFDPASVARHLAANPQAIFIGTAESAQQVRALVPKTASRVHGVSETGERIFRHAGIMVRAFPLLHSGRRHWADPQSLGFIVEMSGKRFFHSGDSEGTLANYRERCEGCGVPDAALVAYWYIMTSSNRSMLRNFLRPKRLIAIHVPPAELEEASVEVRKTNPETEFFPVPGARICLD